ncbi:MAG: 16S rRNA processing protein RimM [Bacteroidales bacterium]|nr:16S rRNA processing protein RimM [Bacteroidales bacterium]
MFNNFFFLGKITKRFGLVGELILFIDSDEPAKYHHMESVYFEIEGELIPFFVENIKVKNSNQLIVKFADINNDNADDYIGVELYQPISMLPKLSGNKFYYHEVVGFKVMDVNLGCLGTIEEVLDYPAQAIIKILQGEKEILIPVVDPYILNVNREDKVMEVNTPDGLVDLYLSGN